MLVSCLLVTRLCGEAGSFYVQGWCWCSRAVRPEAPTYMRRSRASSVAAHSRMSQSFVVAMHALGKTLLCLKSMVSCLSYVSARGTRWAPHDSGGSGKLFKRFAAGPMLVPRVLGGRPWILGVAALFVGLLPEVGLPFLLHVLFS